MKHKHTYTCGTCRSSIQIRRWLPLARLYCYICNRTTWHWRQ